ncbi:histidine kinase [Lysinibacillus contaminans]|uniref:histidine kinase n=1 Tax=Lysinibacillus contaminans TaxID=1293441 RepID=A0ABR5K4V0_9BACI|nr:histidine kinase [Lysinibacillus contaminans]
MKGSVKNLEQNNITQCFDNVLKNSLSPIFILSSSRKILQVNDLAIKQFNINLAYNGFLVMDEPSNLKWPHFVKHLKYIKEAEETFYIRTATNEYKLVQFKCHYHVKNEEIVAHATILNHNDDSAYDLYFKQTNYRFTLFSAYDKLPHGIILTNANDTIFDLNNYAEMYLKKEKAQLLDNAHKSIFESFSLKNSDLSTYFSNLTEEQFATIHVVDKSQPNKPLYYEISSAYDNKRNLIVTTIHDETEKIELQQKVEHQQSLNVVGQMAASIAHEIRNPLTSLKGFTDLLKVDATEEAQMYLSVIDSELQRMDQILSELLMLSKPANNRLELLEFDKLVQHVIDFMMPDALMKNVMIQLVSSPMNVLIEGNENRLKQVVMNLIKNAIESMYNGGTVLVEMRVNSGSLLELSITDEGSGMTSDTIENLFQPFYTTKTTGTGLGLPFVKKVIEEHDGEIVIESELKKGTRFSLHLPIHTFDPLESLDSNIKNSNYLVT